MKRLLGCGILIGVLGVIAFEVKETPLQSEPLLQGADLKQAKTKYTNTKYTKWLPLTSTDNNPSPGSLPGFPASDLPSLSSLVLSSKASADRRQQALYHLTTLGRRAVPALTSVARAPLPPLPNFKNPHSSDHEAYVFEKGLRVSAIEALDRWASKGENVILNLRAVRDSHQERDLIFLANLAIAGIQEGRPGKVTRFINKMFDEALHGK